MLDRQRFVQLMGMLGETFRVELGELALQGYWVALSDLDPEAFDGAVETAVRTLDRFPMPKTLRELVEGKPDDRAIVAWESVKRALATHGVYRSVDFEDRIINAAVRSLGGWTRLGQRSAADFDVWAKKEFIAAYGAFASRGVSEDQAAPLPGLAEAANGLRFAAHTETVRIPARTRPLLAIAAGETEEP
jgi:hypothetical protein